MPKVIDLAAAKKAVKSRKYKDLVMDAYEKLQHQENRDKRELASEVRRKARGTI